MGRAVPPQVQREGTHTYYWRLMEVAARECGPVTEGGANTAAAPLKRRAGPHILFP